ncbi:MAG TPA: porin family protein [Bacteroidales bacterium]|nr:porin family protein [Bacteroidales bacterium]
MNSRILKSVFAFSILVLSLTTNAQVSLNVKHGIVASTFSKLGNLSDNNNVSLSYTAGFFAVIPTSQYFAIQPEINYIRKGRFEKETSMGVSNRIYSSANYLQIPLMIRYTAPSVFESPNTKLFLNTGIYDGILLHSERRIKIGDELAGKDQTSDYKGNDWGLIFGGGVQFPFRQFLVQFDLRYDMGLTKITNQNDNYTTKALSLTMGVKF